MFTLDMTEFLFIQHRVLVAVMDPQESQARQVPMAPMVKMDFLDCLAHAVNLEFRDFVEAQVSPAPLDPRVMTV